MPFAFIFSKSVSLPSNLPSNYISSSNDTIRSSLATSCDIPQHHARFSNSWSFLNGLLNHVVKELNVEEVLKSPIFVVQKAAAPKTGVEFRQGSIGTIRSSLATSHDASRRRARSPNFDQSEAEKLSHTHTQSTYCQALLSEQRLQKFLYK